MKHIEVSRKIVLQRPASPVDFKQALVERLEKAIQIDSIGDGHDKFRLTGTTGSPASLTRSANVDLDIAITFDAQDVRLIISGYTRPARSLSVLYWAMFFTVLLVGLLPGSIETSADTSDSMDVLVLLIFGIFIVFDVNKKMAEPREFLATALDSLETIYG